MLENVLASISGKMAGVEGEGEEEKKMAVTALVAMIEIWMSDLWYVASSTLSRRGAPLTVVLSLRQNRTAML